jgi:hypothetical protein
VRAGIAGNRQLDVLMPRHVDGVEPKDVRNRLASIPPAHGLMSQDPSSAGEEDPIGNSRMAMFMTLRWLASWVNGFG